MKDKVIYKADINILTEDSSNLAYNVENSNLIKLEPIEVDILKYIKKDGSLITDLINHFSYIYGKEKIQKAMEELVKVGLLKSTPFKGISHDEIINFEETFYNKIKQWPLLQILLNVTHRCNLACRYCYADYGSYKGPSTHMKREVAKQSVDFLLKASGDSALCRITFFGGEPLLNFDLIRYIVEYAKEKASKCRKKILFGLTTNGTLLDDDKIEFILRENMDVTLSIDGPEEIQDLNRPFKGNKKEGSYKIIYPKIKRFIEEAKKKDRFFAVRSTLTGLSCVNIRKVVNFFNKLGVERIKFAFAENEEYPNQKDSSHMFITDKILLQFREEIKKVADQYIEAKLNNRKTRLATLLLGALKEIERKTKRYNICTTMGTKFVGISVNGDIFPCHRFISYPETRIGNVWDGIDKSWLERMKKIHIFNSPACSKCWLRYICGGMCPNTNYLLGKEFTLSENANPVYCKGMKILFEEALILYAKLKAVIPNQILHEKQ